VGRPGLARLIDEAISAFGYDVCLLRAPDGRRRFANVRKLMRLAEEFERVSGPDLAGLTAVLDLRGRAGDREGTAPTLAEGEDVVRVMTVHQAKGLEFPVVVVAGLGADFHRPETGTFVVGSDGRTGVFLKGYRNETYETHDPCWGPAAEIAAEEVEKEREEDIRLLYVAMTRAQERLVLVGARPQKDAIEGSRIGRILRALGLTTFPKGGETVSVEGLSAVVVGAEPPAATVTSEATSSSGAVAEAGRLQEGGPAGLVEAEGYPRLLELSRRAGAPDRVSFSALAAYERCPRRFYLERVLGLTLGAARLGEDEGADESCRAALDDEERSAGLNVGILVHRLLEQLPLDAERPAVDRLRETAEEAAFTGGLRLSPQDFERAIGLTLAAWDSPWAERLAWSSVRREAPFFFAHGDTVVYGVMDLVCQEPDRWQVVDYKTNALKGRGVDELAKDYALQGQVYCLAALRAGAPAVRMDFLFLERPCEPMTVLCAPEDMERLEERLSDALAGMRAHDFSPRWGSACAGCGVRAACKSMASA
jgi:ATP-dependent exoDNAse (exonuclease V) beta subunit